MLLGYRGWGDQEASTRSLWAQFSTAQNVRSKHGASDIVHEQAGLPALRDYSVPGIGRHRGRSIFKDRYFP